MEALAVEETSSRTNASQPTTSQPQASSSTSSQRNPKRSHPSSAVDGRQAYEEEEETPTQELDELYVTLKTDVVGVKYYQGLVGRGEYVMLRRQPDNQYDANAVQVMNASGTQVGHIPRQVAARIAPLMDGKLISVEGRMIGQNLDRATRFKLPMDMCIYARPSHRPHLEPELEWATPMGRGFDAMRRQEASQARPPARGKGKGRTLGETGVGGSGGGVRGGQHVPPVDEEILRILDGLTKVSDDEKAADGVMSALTKDLDVANLPLHPSPPSLASGDLLVDLLSHQSQALKWMIDHENPVLPQTPESDPVQFWKLQKSSIWGEKGYWLNVATKTPQVATPVLGRGGIVADGMGLGKTLTTLSLVLATKDEPVSPGYTGTTLIVCPLSVLSNWEKQLADHVVEGKLSCYSYHGANKGAKPVTLEKYDIVLATYQTVAAEIASSALSAPSKGKKVKTTGTGGPLMNMKWKRVVADEGHVMKNPKAKLTQAFVALQAERRWICSGTPIVNSPGDLGSLLTCLHICAPLDNIDYWRSLIMRPLKAGSAEAGKLLQAIVGQILLRRTKETKDADGKLLVSLPPIEYYQCPVQLDAKTREIYDVVHAESARLFQESMTSDSSSNGATVLSMLTRMRQLCLSADMVPPSYLEDLRKPPEDPDVPATSISSLAKEDQDKLIERLKQAVADQEECAVCYDVLDDPRITDCGHSFCFICICEVITRQHICPMDRHPLNVASLLELPPDAANDFDEFDDTVTSPKRSAKITELVRYLKAFDGNDKTLVFSQFTSFLDRVAAVLQEEGISFCRFDGSMNARRRQEVIAKFQTPITDDNRKTNPVVMLISLKSGAVGLNLTAANNVFLCDPWWQSAIEAQAVDRVHRMGQQKTVRVFQLIAEDTIEAKVLEIQKRKDALVAQAFEKSGTRETKAAKKQARFEELKQLFGVK